MSAREHHAPAAKNNHSLATIMPEDQNCNLPVAEPHTLGQSAPEAFANWHVTCLNAKLAMDLLEKPDKMGRWPKKNSLTQDQNKTTKIEVAPRLCSLDYTQKFQQDMWTKLKLKCAASKMPPDVFSKTASSQGKGPHCPHTIANCHMKDPKVTPELTIILVKPQFASRGKASPKVSKQNSPVRDMNWCPWENFDTQSTFPTGFQTTQ